MYCYRKMYNKSYSFPELKCYGTNQMEVTKNKTLRDSKLENIQNWKEETS